MFKNFNKKIFSIFTIFTILLSNIVLTNNVKAVGENISGSSLSVKVGDSISVPIIGTNLLNAYGMNTSISFDNTKLTLDCEKVTLGSVPSSATVNCTANSYTVSWDDVSAVDLSGTLFTLNFKVVNNPNDDISLNFGLSEVVDENGDPTIYSGTPSPIVVHIKNNDATLSAITGVVTNEVFASSTKTYTATVPYSTTSVTLGATKTDTDASITPADLGLKTLNVGVNNFTIHTLAEDGVTADAYTLAITRSQNTAKAISSFSVSINGTPVVATVDEGAKTVDFEVPYSYMGGASTSWSFSPTIVISEVATVSPNTGVSHTFSDGVGETYTVTAQDGSSQGYLVTATKAVASTDADLSALSFSGITLNEVFNAATTSYTATVPFSTINSTISASIHHPYAVITPADLGLKTLNVGVNNFSVNVTAEDGVTLKTYDIAITRSQNTEKQISGFTVPGQIGSSVIDQTVHTINITVPYLTDVTNLIPTIVISEVATVSPNTGVANDFTNQITYTVTAQNGLTQDYDVIITKQAPSILTFNFTTPSAIGVIGANIVNISVPCGTNVQNLIPTITTEGSSTISPVSGLVQNFTNSINYTVSDTGLGLSKVYTVNVVVQSCGGYAYSICTDVTYSNWGNCINGKQYRTLNSKYPLGCTLTNEQGSLAVRACSSSDTIVPVAPIVVPITTPATPIFTVIETPIFSDDNIIDVLPFSDEEIKKEEIKEKNILENIKVRIFSNKYKKLEIDNKQANKYYSPLFRIEGGNNILGYYVYFGKDKNIDPIKYGKFITKTEYQGYVSKNGEYYFVIKAKDKNNNISNSYILKYTYSSSVKNNFGTLEKISGPSQIKNYMNIEKIGNDLWGYKRDNILQTKEKISGPSQIKNYMNIEKIGNDLWGYKI